MNKSYVSPIFRANDGSRERPPGGGAEGASLDQVNLSGKSTSTGRISGESSPRATKGETCSFAYVMAKTQGNSQVPRTGTEKLGAALAYLSPVPCLFFCEKRLDVFRKTGCDRLRSTKNGHDRFLCNLFQKKEKVRRVNTLEVGAWQS